ncbi:MAG: pre-peptidase C-terminal domain-containing protein, partial [Nostocaceae cyanobacterium]|nr:pre-peptidase C-terminal domain-containing protein [Nostocaceae cyanobacterium]
NESISQTLGAGTYFIRVYPDSSADNTNYTLGVSATPALPTTPTEPGNTFATALNLSTVSSNPSSPTTFRDFVGIVDSNDYYRLTLGRTSSVNVSVTGVTNDVRLEVIYDTNGNGIYESSERLYLSDNFGNNANESISQTLGAGTYFIRVYPDSSSDNTNYTLGVSATVR